MNNTTCYALDTRYKKRLTRAMFLSSTLLVSIDFSTPKLKNSMTWRYITHDQQVDWFTTASLLTYLSHGGTSIQTLSASYRYDKFNSQVQKLDAQ